MSIDRFLRAWGFAIHERAGDAEPKWRDRRTGRVCYESLAFRIAQERAAQAADEPPPKKK